VTIGSVNSPCAVSGWLRRKVADPGEQPGPFGLLHDQEVGVRADGGQQGIGGTGLAVPELAHLGRGEQVRSPAPSSCSCRDLASLRATWSA
jgi:hypothetical protein